MRRGLSAGLTIAVVAVGLVGTSSAEAAPECPDRRTHSVSGTVSLTSSSSVNDPIDQSHGFTAASATMTGTWPVYDTSRQATFSGTASTQSELVIEATPVRNKETSTSQGTSSFTQDDNLARATVTSQYCTVTAEITFAAMAHGIWTVYDPDGNITRQDVSDIPQPVGRVSLNAIPVVDGVASGSSTGSMSPNGTYADYDADLYATSGTVGQRSNTESGTPTSSITVTWSFSVKYVDEIPSVSVEDLHIEDQSVSNPGTWATVMRTHEGNDTRIRFLVRNDKPAATGTVTIDDAVSGRLIRRYEAQTFPTGDTPYELPWDTDGWAWEANQTASSNRTLRVTVVVDGGFTAVRSANVVVAPRPVVLVHGLWSDAGAWTGFDERLRAVNYEWRAYAVGDGQFPGTMYTGEKSAPLTPAYTVGLNAAMEWQYITALRKSLNARQVDVVAHSLGGIITRFLINRLMPATGVRPIRTLKMLGTPNGGSTCADTYSVPATAPLRTATMQRFNAMYPGYRDVPTSLTYSLKLFVTCLDPSPGDMVVPWWSSLAVPTNQRDRLDMLHTSMTDDEEMFRDRIVPWLARSPEEDFPSTLITGQAMAAQPAAPSRPVQIAGTGRIADAAKPSAAIVLQKGESMTVTVVAPPGTSARLVGPNGKTVALRQADDWPVFTATIPASGARTSWRLTGSAVSEPSQWTAAVSSSNFLMERNISRADTSYTVKVRLALSGKPLLKARVAASASPVAGGRSTALTLRDDGRAGDAKANDGVYTVRAAMTKGADLNVAIRAVAPDGRERFATVATVDSF